MTTLNFKGKSVIRTYHLTVPFRQLTPNPKKSLTKSPSLRDNLIVHGDNLLALKALLPSFSGKVKCIYIDPPYNTGNEKWVYNDNVNSPMHQDWLKKVVDREDLTRHEKWLCMMWPRLVLLRELLADDGAIFISIDDNEVHHLRAIMDELFGEENFVSCSIWQRKYSPQNDDKGISALHEYILIYARDKTVWYPNLLERTEENLGRYKNPDNDPRGPWKPGDLTSKTKAAGHSYPITSPTGKVFKPKGQRQWAPSLETFSRLLADNRIWFGPDGNNVPSLKQFLSEVQQGTVPTSLWLRELVGDNQEAVKQIQELDILFDSPKPTGLVKRILQIASDKNTIVLDSFAGSATTAQAILELNAEDGGNRKFILIEQEDYADKVTAERVRRVIKGVKNAKDEKLREGLGGTFTYYTLGDTLAEENLLKGGKMPSYKDLARYVFFTATGEQLDDAQVDEKRFYLGESRNYQVYLLYKPDMEFLKHRPLDLDFVKGLGKPKSKTRLVIASHKYVDDFVLNDTRVEFCQLPFAIYRFRA
jgi:adenine-specific DNA-methyltransferase